MENDVILLQVVVQVLCYWYRATKHDRKFLLFPDSVIPFIFYILSFVLTFSIKWIAIITDDSDMLAYVCLLIHNYCPF